MGKGEGGRGNDRKAHRVVHQAPRARGARRDLRARGWRVPAPHDAGGCDPGSLGYASDRLHRLPGPGAPSRRGPGDLSVTHHVPCRPQGESRARAVNVQLVLRVRDLPGPDRSLLGPLAGARVPERDPEPAPRRRQDPARTGRHRRRLGLSVRPRGSRLRARPAPLDPGLSGAVRPAVRAGRSRGRESGRLRAPVPGSARPGPAPRLRRNGARGHRGRARGQPGCGGAHGGGRGLGYFRGVGDIEKVAVGVGKDGRPVRVGDVARVTIGPDLRLGIAERDGRREAVGGVVVMRYGENALRVIDGVKQRIAEIAPALPAGVRIVPTYDRSDLIHGSIKTLWRTLLEESVIVALVCAVFLLHARSALVAIATLPLGILVSLAVTRWLGINGNIMSLGGIAIAIGAMIDAAIVMLENLHKHIEHEPDRPHWERVFAAAREVGPALFMSLLIITLSFLPVFTLEDQEGRLFRPLALTKTFAMAAAALLSVTLVPALMGWFVKGKIRAEAENPLNRWALQLYRPVLQWALRARWQVLGGAAGLILLTLLPLGVLGSEFMPPLNEGSLMYMPNTLPALSLTTQRRLLHVEDSILMTFPEVASVWGKAGRANTATDWAPMSMVETVVNLKPESEWRRGMTQDRLIAEMDQRLRLTGAVNTWTMPIKNRTDMLSTGVRTTLAVKIFGPDLQTIQRIGQDIERALAPLPGSASVYAERSFGGRYLDIRPDADALARYGLTTGDAQEVISLALGGEEITTTVEGRERYPVQVRYASDFRDDPTTISRLLVGSRDGPQVPLGQVAPIQFSPGPPMIRSEGGYLYDQVSIDVRGRDVGSYVRDAQGVVAREVKLPTGYWLRWSGQYEAIERVKARLQVVVPLTLGIIALLLYLTFGTVDETAIVMLSLPFALVGGVWIMWLLDYNLSIAVAVGFIALAGVAAETGVVMLIYLDHAWEAVTQGGRRPTLAELVGAIEHGAVNRVRPKLMTVLAIMLGLVPALWSHGAGASVMKRIAAPMVGGMVTSTILTLIVIPVIYYLWRRRGLEG